MAVRAVAKGTSRMTEDAILWAILTACAFALVGLLDEWAWVVRDWWARRAARRWLSEHDGKEGV